MDTKHLRDTTPMINYITGYVMFQRICKALNKLANNPTWRQLFSKTTWETECQMTIPVSPTPDFWTVEWDENDPLLKRRYDVRQLSTDILTRQLTYVRHDVRYTEPQRKVILFKISMELESRLFNPKPTIVK